MKVLIVDDAPLPRIALRRTVEALGYEVVEATSGADALKALSDDMQIEIVLTDFQMPGMNGLELALQIKTLPADQQRPVILITGEDDPDDLSDDALTFGIKRVLPKTQGFPDLKRELEQAVLRSGPADWEDQG